MELKVCWMYHNIMDLYGDKGNMMVLKKRCLDRNIEIVIDTCGINEEKDLCDYDLIFLGGGADKEQKMIISDLLSRKENILKAIDEKSFFFLVCGGYQLFGQYYIGSNNEKIDGLNIFEYYSESDEGHRCVGNIAIEVNLNGNTFKMVGFENHGGQTKNVSSPLGKVLKGYGNTYESTYEGFYSGQVLGTYMHGPLFPKNPQMADFVIYKGLKKRNPDLKLEDLQLLDDTLEHKALDAMLHRLGV